MSYTNQILNWFHSNPDALVVFGIVLIICATAIDAKAKGKSWGYVAGTSFVMFLVGVMVGLLFYALR